MENYIKINGQTLTEEQSKIMAKIAEDLGYINPETAAAMEPKKVDLYARRIGEGYWYMTVHGEVFEDIDKAVQLDKARYEVGNYYPDKESAQQQAWRETLDRLLRRYSEQHGGDPEWNDVNEHWCILDIGIGKFGLECTNACKTGVPYFCNKEVADAAIRDVVEPFCKAHPEFVW